MDAEIGSSMTFPYEYPSAQTPPPTGHYSRLPPVMQVIKRLLAPWPTHAHTRSPTVGRGEPSPRRKPWPATSLPMASPLLS